MKLLLLLVCLIAFSQPISNTEQVAFANEVQMRTRYNEMLAALNDFGVASDRFVVQANGGYIWPLTEGRALEIKADLFIRAWHRVYVSDGWISTQKTER